MNEIYKVPYRQIIEAILVYIWLSHEEVGGLGLPNVCFVVRREIMHLHHTRARAAIVRPTDRAGHGYGSKMTILLLGHRLTVFGFG